MGITSGLYETSAIASEMMLLDCDSYGSKSPFQGKDVVPGGMTEFCHPGLFKRW